MSISFAATPQAKEAQQARSYTDASAGAPPSRRSGSNAPYVDLGHWNKVFTDQSYFDSLAKQKGMAEGAKVSLHGDDYVYRQAMIGYLADTRKVPLDDMRSIFDAEKDGFAQKVLGKQTASARELFDWQKGQFERSNEKKAAADQILQGVIRRSLEDALSGGDTPFVESVGKDIDAASEMFDDEEKSRLWEKAEELDMKIRASQDRFAPEARFIFDALQQSTGQKAGLGAPDMREMASRFAQLPDNQRKAIYELAGGFAQITQTDKGFWYQMAESLGRGASDIVERVPRNFREQTLRGQLRLLNGQQPLFRAAGVAGAQFSQAGPQGAAPLTPEEREEAKAKIEADLGVLKVERELRDLAERVVDPIKTVSFLPEIVEEGLYGAARSLPYTAAAAIPFAGIPAVASALFSSNYDRIMLEYPDLDPDKAALIAAISAPIEAGLERMKVNTITGRLPVVGGLVKRLQHPNQRNLTRIMIGAGGIVVEQNIQETIQELTFPVVRTIAAALDADMPDYDWEKRMANYPRELAVQFVALLPLSLMGVGALSYREIKRGENYLKSKADLEKMGYSPEQIDRITGAESAEAAQAALVEEHGKRDPALVKAAAQRVVDEVLALREQSNPAALPRLEKQGADYVVFSPEGKELARTTDQTAAEQALVSARRETVQREMRDVHTGINEAVAFIQKVNEARQRGEDIAEVIREEAPRTLLTDYEANPTQENLDRLFETVRAFGQDINEPAELANFPVTGSNQGALREGIWRSIIRINEGADGTIVMREFAQDNLKRAMAEGRVTIDFVRQQLNDILPQIDSDRMDRQLRTETDTDVIEAFSDIAVAYFRGSIREEQIPAGLRGIIRRLAIVTRDIFRRAYNLARLRAEGKLDRDFEALLAEAIGVDQQALVDRARERTEQEVGAESVDGASNYSIAAEPSRVVMGININDSAQDFTGQILRGEKTIETRATQSLNPYVGKRVGIVRTGVGRATLVGYATIGEPITYLDEASFRADESKHRVSQGSEFDIGPEGKFGYPLLNVESTDPKEVVARGIVARSLQNYSIGITPQQDTDYLAAVERGDLEAAQRMVDEAARAAGYNIGPVWHGTNAQDRKFKVFRTDSGSTLGEGAYFTTNEEMANRYDSDAAARRFYLRVDLPNFGQYLDGLTIEEIAQGKTVATEGQSDTAAWTVTYGDVEIAVRNPENIKSADPVTRDSQGNVIPLSQRFDATTADINYSIGSRAVLSQIDSVLDMPENPPSVETAAQEGGKVRSIAKLFREIMGEDSIDYGSLTEEGMAERVSEAGDRMLDVLLRAAYEFPQFASWYESRLKMALDIFTELDPDVAKPDNQAALLITLAITSNGADVATQTEDGWDVYSHWKQSGRLAGSVEKRGSQRGAETENKLVIADKLAEALGGYAKLGEFLNRKGTVSELRTAMTEQLGGTFTKEEIQRLTNGELVDEIVPFSLIFGPKLGSFFNNMSGDFSTITMDRWFMRTFGRTMGTQLVAIAKNVMAKKDARLKQAIKGYKGDILQRAKIAKGVKDPRQIAEALGKFFQKSENRSNLTEQENAIRLAANDLFKVADGFVLKEAPDSGTHRRWIRAAMTDAITKFNAQTNNQLVPAEAQALLWYYEKLVHDTYGSRQKDASPDYASAANKLFVRERGVGSDRFQDSDGIKRRSGGGRSAAFGGFSSGGESGAAVDNYSISTQREIDRVQAAMGALDRSPLSRLKVYEKMQEKFLRVMADNREMLAGMQDGDLAQMRRTQILQALGELDGIISVLPPEVRSKIGGYTQLAKVDPMDVFKGDEKVSEVRGMSGAIISAWMREGLNIGEAQKKTALPDGYRAERNLDPTRADRAIADVFIQRINRINEALEKFLRDEYNTAAVELFKRAKPQRSGAGEKPKGKLGADVHDLFDTLKEATEWSAEQAQAWADGQWARIESGELNPYEETHAMMAAQMVPLFADWANADSSQRAAAVTMGKDVLNRAYKGEQQRIIAQRTKRGYDRTDLSKDAGVSAEDDVARNQRVAKENSLPSKFESMMLNLLNFEQVLAYIFGENSAVARRMTNMQRKADNTKTDGVIKLSEDWAAFTSRLAGDAMSGEQLVYRLSEKTFKLDDYTFSQNELIAITMMWMQPKGRQHMEGFLDSDGQPAGKWHYGQDFVNKAERLLTPEAKAVREYLLAKYDAEYEAINKVYRKVYGLNLPKNQFYSPLVVESIRAPAQTGIDPVTGGVFAASSNTPSAFFTRGGAIAQPVFRDAVQTYLAHMMQMEHWKAYAEFNSEAAALLGHRDTRNVATAKAGEQATTVLNGWLTFFNQGGNKEAASHLAITQFFNNMLGRASTMALFGRIGTLVIQTTQLGAAAAKMPVAAYMTRFAKLMSGQLGWGAALDSPYIQRRIKQMPPQVQVGMMGLRGDKPSKVREAARQVGWLISGMDGLFTAGTYAIVYDYQMAQLAKSGITGAEAESIAREEAERITDEVAQPTRSGARSLYELNASGPLARVIWAFSSEARKNLGLLLFSAAKRSKGDLARAALYVMVFNGVLATIIRSAIRDIRDGDDEELFDEKNWSAARLLGMVISEPLYGFPVVGEVFEKAIFSALGVYKPDGSLFDVQGAVPALKRIPSNLTDIMEGEADWRVIMRDTNRLLSATGLFNGTIAGAASLSNLAKDIFEATEANLPE